MIVGPGGENIYPEDIETVLNSHVYIADSIVTEQEGRLVALVHFNRDEIEAMIDNWREEWETKKEAWEAKTEQLKKEIMDFVNAKVNRFSRISEVVEEKDDFAKDSDAQDQTVPVQQEQRQRQTAAGTACRKTRNQMTRRLSAEGCLVILRQTCLLPGRRMRRAICRNSGRGERGCSP